jgi:hypothetical protein
MPDLHDPPSKHQPPPHHQALASFIQAAAALLEAWHPSLDRGRPRYLPAFADFLTDLHDWQTAATEPAHAAAAAPPPLDLADPAVLRAWLADLRLQLDDALGAGDDATRPPGQRDLGRREARRLLFGARATIAALLASAERALPPTGPVPG